MRKSFAGILTGGAAFALTIASSAAVAQTQPAAGPEAGAPPPSSQTAATTDTSQSSTPFTRDAIIDIGILAALTAIVLVATHDSNKSGGGNGTSPASP